MTGASGSAKDRFPEKAENDVVKVGEANAKKKRFLGAYYGWWMILAMNGIAAVDRGIWAYSFGAFIDPMCDEFGWTRAEISMGISLSNLETGFESVYMGWLTDKFGPRWPMIISILFSGFLLVLLGFVDSLFMFYVLFIVVAVAPTALFVPMATSVANWFKKKIGKAMGLFQTGYAWTGLLAPLLVWLIAQYGWRTTFVIAGIMMWIICIPLTFFIRHTPEQYGLLPDGETPGEKKDVQPSTIRNADFSPEEKDYTLREALKSLPFWLISIAYGLSSFAFSAIILHVIPYLISIGFSAETAALGTTVITVSSFFGRLGFGWLCDVFKKRYVFAACFAGQLIGLLILANVSITWAVFLALVIWGPSYGGQMSSRVAIQSEYYGRKYWGVTQGVLMGITVVPSIVGPIFAGWIFDITGSYSPAFRILTLLWLAATLLILLAKPPVGRPEKTK